MEEPSPSRNDSPDNSNPTHPITTTKMPPSPQLQLEPVQLWTGGAATTTKPKYKECLKNHAVSIGGHAVDGCGEFLPSGEDGSIGSLKCAACNCHRNFHRKITQPPPLNTAHGGEPAPFVYYRSMPPPPYGYLQYHVAPHHRPLALPSTSGGGYREDQEDISNPNYSGGSGSKKRFRTKFSQEQKDKMQEVADKLGWRIQREDEELVQNLCNETGITRQVFKVWMHNNKHTLGKKP